MNARPNSQRQQKGVVLFITLVLLLVLTIIGVSSLQTTSLELRMSRNEHDRLLAFQAAESALRDAELRMKSVTSVSLFNNTAGLYRVTELGGAQLWRDEAIWRGSNSLTGGALAGTAAAPRYIIEYIGPVVRDENAFQQDDPYAASSTIDRVEMFRITALGTGGTVNAQVLLQSTFGRIMD